MSPADRRAAIQRNHAKLSLTRQCQLLSISRSSISCAPVGESPETLALMREIDRVFTAYRFFGSRQIVQYLAWEGIRVGRHRVQRLMRRIGLEAVYRRPKTSQPHPQHQVYPYRLGKMEITRPGQVWCADITFIPVRRGFLYLVAITDWATRR
jgi:putative transposase